jgi:hypothetical protein
MCSIMLRSQKWFTDLEYLDDEVYIWCAWETIRENVNISAKESLGY